jgi:hypothetical protein
MFDNLVSIFERASLAVILLFLFLHMVKALYRALFPPKSQL